VEARTRRIKSTMNVNILIGGGGVCWTTGSQGECTTSTKLKEDGLCMSMKPKLGAWSI